MLVNPRYIRTTEVTPEEKIAFNIHTMFYLMFGLQGFGLIVAFLNFRRNSIQAEREDDY